MQGIYKIQNSINNKVYIGSSTNIYKRVNYHHYGSLRKNIHWNVHIQEDWNLFGEDKFYYELIEEIEDQENLLDREFYWMEHYQSLNRDYGYNIADPFKKIISEETKEKMRIEGIKRGAPLGSGWKHTEEAKRKISEAGKGRILRKRTEEEKRKIGDRVRGKTYEEMYGKEKAEEMKRKQAERQKGHKWNVGVKQSEETKRKRADKLRGRKHTEETKIKCGKARFKPVPLEIKKEIVELFDSGKSMRQISHIVNWSEYKVKEILKEYGRK